MKETPKECEELSGKICDLIDEYESTLDISQVIGILSTLVIAYFTAGRES